MNAQTNILKGSLQTLIAASTVFGLTSATPSYALSPSNKTTDGEINQMCRMFDPAPNKYSSHTCFITRQSIPSICADLSKLYKESASHVGNSYIVESSSFDEEYPKSKQEVFKKSDLKELRTSINFARRELGCL